jgi:hypothetical protein
MPISVKMLFSALEEIRTPNLLIRSNHAYCDVLNEKWAVQPTGRANRTRNSQMLSVRRPRAPYGATYGARSITAWLIAGSQRSRLSGRSTIMLPSYRGPLTSSHRCLVVGGHQKLPSGGQQNLRQAATECGDLPSHHPSVLGADRRIGRGTQRVERRSSCAQEVHLWSVRWVLRRNRRRRARSLGDRSLTPQRACWVLSVGDGPVRRSVRSPRASRS